jgi:hypothetical protein
VSAIFVVPHLERVRLFANRMLQAVAVPIYNHLPNSISMLLTYQTLNLPPLLTVGPLAQLLIVDNLDCWELIVLVGIHVLISHV